MPAFPRDMDDVYTLEEVEHALEGAKGYLAEDVIRSVLERMKRGRIQEIPKRLLSETAWECLDWALKFLSKEGC